MKDADGNEVTVQTKPVDSEGKAPVEEKVIKVRHKNNDLRLACR